MKGKIPPEFEASAITAALQVIGVDAESVVVCWETENNDLKILVAAEMGLFVYLHAERENTFNEYATSLLVVHPWSDIEVTLTTRTVWDNREKRFVSSIQLHLGELLAKPLHSADGRDDYEGVRLFAQECQRRALIARI